MNIHNKHELAAFVNATQRCLEESAARIANSMDTREAPKAEGLQIIDHEIFYSIKMFPAHFDLHGECKRFAKVIRTTKTTEEI